MHAASILTPTMDSLEELVASFVKLISSDSITNCIKAQETLLIAQGDEAHVRAKLLELDLACAALNILKNNECAAVDMGHAIRGATAIQVNKAIAALESMK